MKTEPSPQCEGLSEENRALIEADLSCWIPAYAPDEVLHLCASDLNRLLNAARATHPGYVLVKREVLEPFAKHADWYDNVGWPDRKVLCWHAASSTDESTVTLGDFRAIRQALAATPVEGLGDLGSLRPKDGPLAPGGDVDASRQSGDEG